MKSNMIELVTGIAIGAGGMMLKEKMSNPSNQQANARQREMDELYAENEKFRQRHKEAERQVEDLLAEADKLRRQLKERENGTDDMEDALDKAKAEIKKLRTQNDDLCNKLQEYKTACANYEVEIRRLKDQLN